MGLKELCQLLSIYPDMQKRIQEFILCLREGPKTKKEIMEELVISEKQFKRIARKLREIGLLHNYRDENNIAHYFLSYEGFSTWLKMLRDTIYNLLKREKA